MIKKEEIKALCEGFLTESQFVVDVCVNTSNDISVYIDDMNGLTISECARVSQAIEQQLDRDVEDFSIEVSSPGLTAPFRVEKQYLKNIGNQIEVLYVDGEKVSGKLVSVTPEKLVIENEVKKKVENKKVVEIEQTEIERVSIKTVKNIISF